MSYSDDVIFGILNFQQSRVDIDDFLSGQNKADHKELKTTNSIYIIEDGQNRKQKIKNYIETNGGFDSESRQGALMLLNESSDGGGAMGTQSRIFVDTENNSLKLVVPNPFAFIKTFLAKRVDSLVDITQEKLEQEIEQYRPDIEVENYYYVTQAKSPLTSEEGSQLVSQGYAKNIKFASQIPVVGNQDGRLYLDSLLRNRRRITGYKFMKVETEENDVQRAMVVLSTNPKQPTDVSPNVILDGSPYEPSGDPGDGSPKFFTGIDIDLGKNGEYKRIENSTIIRDWVRKWEKFTNPTSYSSKELAQIFRAILALRILGRRQKELEQIAKGESGAEYEATLSAPEVIQDTLKREFNANPDFKEDIDTEKAKAKLFEKLEISPQCYLIRNIIEAAKLNRKRLNSQGKSRKYQKLRLVSNPDNTAATLNLLTRKKTQKNLLDMMPHHISKMMPYLRIWKVIYNSNSKLEEEVEFKFPNAANVKGSNRRVDIKEDILEKGLYTQDYGVKSFNWNLIGSDPFSYSNDIDATLVLHFNDFEQLTVERSQDIDGKTHKYKMLDLIMAEKTENDITYDIRVDVGWSGPNKSELNEYDTKESIRTLFLAMADYDIAFNPEGFFELTINYKARLEQTMYDRKMNILNFPKDIQEDIDGIKKMISEAKNGDNKELVRKLESDLGKIQFDAKGQGYKNILDQLFASGAIFSEEATSEQLFDLDSGGVSFQDNTKLNDQEARSSFQRLNSIIDLQVKEPEFFDNWWYFTNLIGTSYNVYNYLTFDKEEEIKRRHNKLSKFIPSKSGRNYVINFFFLGDLIEALTKETTDPTKFDLIERPFVNDIRVVTTDFLIYDPSNPSSKKIEKINISDIPISVDLFMKFYYEKVLKFSVSHYSLMKFVRDIISYCVLNIFEECFGEDNLKTTLKTGFIDFKKEGKKDPFEHYAKLNNLTSKQITLGGTPIPGTNYKEGNSLQSCFLDLRDRRVPKPASTNSRIDCTHTLVISSESLSPEDLEIKNYSSRRIDDNKIGLYHLDVGSQKGILKSINFSKTDQKYLKEQRMTQDETRPFSILSNVFDVDINLVGNTIFFPGQRVYINLGERFSALGAPYKNKSKAQIMGLGGYHLVTGVENEINTEGFNTKIKCRWENSGNGKNSDPSQGLVTIEPIGVSSPEAPNIDLSKPGVIVATK